MKFLYLLALVFLPFLSCKELNHKTTQEAKEQVNNSSSLENSEGSILKSSVAEDTIKIVSSPTKINNSLGLITLVDNITQKDTVKIYNKDESEWHRFSFFYDDSDGVYDFKNPDFSPYAFNPDSFTLCLRVVHAAENGMFEVIVNEETNTKKYIKSTAKGLQFQTWEACIASLFAVEFDASKNPILEKVGAPEPTISYDRNEIYHPNELEGNWLQIKWGNEDHWEYGWIKWRNGEELLIEPFFSG